jgi:hypothetical protein
MRGEIGRCGEFGTVAATSFGAVQRDVGGAHEGGGIEDGAKVAGGDAEAAGDQHLVASDRQRVLADVGAQAVG